MGKDIGRIQFRLHRRDFHRPTSLTSNALMQVLEDSRHRIFICTESGGVEQVVTDDGEKMYAGDAQYAQGKSWGLRWTNTLNYVVDIAEHHNLNILLGQEVTNSGGESIGVNATHFPANFTKDNAFAMINQYDPSAGKTTNFYSGHTTPERILSYFGRLNYNLHDRYLLTFTMRADGSSKFSPEHRWGYFPAAAAA